MQAFKGWRLKTDEDLSLEISYEIGEGTVEIREWEAESIRVRLGDLVKWFQVLRIWDWESEIEKERDAENVTLSLWEWEDLYEIAIREREREWLR